MVFCMLSLDYQHLLLEENLSFLGRTLVWRNPQADRRCPSGLEEGVERSHNLCTKWCSRRNSFWSCTYKVLCRLVLSRLQANSSQGTVNLCSHPAEPWLNTLPSAELRPQTQSCTCWDPSPVLQELGRVTLHPGTGPEKVPSPCYE